MLTLLHGSDLHFGKPYKPEAGEAFLETMHRIDPDLIVISGDLTQRAKIREYEEARSFLDRFPDVPLVVTPGNHDVPLYRVFERLFAPYRNYRRFIEPQLDTVTRIPGATVVALNSSAPRRAIVNGRIEDGQLAFAREAFRKAAPGDTRILVAHHHLAPAPDYESDTVIPRARKVLEWCTEVGVELILGGHLHRAYIGNSLDVYPGRNGQRGIVIVQSGTTTSHRGRARESARNSFNVIRIADSYLEITHFMHFLDAGGFAPFSMHAYPRRDEYYFSRDPFAHGLAFPDDAEGTCSGPEEGEGG